MRWRNIINSITDQCVDIDNRATQYTKISVSHGFPFLYTKPINRYTNYPFIIYSSIAYLGGFTIIAFATIWFLSQSPACTIEYGSKGKSEKSEKSNKKSDNTSKPGKHNNNTNKGSVSWWSAIREKITSKFGFGKKSKSTKNATKTGKPSSSRGNSSNGSNRNKSEGKKRIFKDNGVCGNGSSSKSTNITKNDDLIDKKAQGTRIETCGESSSCITNTSNDGMRQKDHMSRKVHANTSDDGLQKKEHCTQEIQVGFRDNNLTSNSNVVKQQQLRKLKLKTQESRSSNWTNCYKLPSRGVESKYKSGDCSKHSENTSSILPVCNIKYSMDNKESSRQDRSLTDIELRIAETVKKINSIDLQGM